MTSNDNLYQQKSNDTETEYNGEIRYLNKGEEDEMEIYGYERSIAGTLLTWICIVLTFGILRLIFHWYQEWMLYCTHRKCPLKLAQTVIVIDKYQGCYKTYFVKTVKRLNLENLSPEDVAVVGNDLNMDNVTSLANNAGTLIRLCFSDGSYIDESNFVTVKVKKLTYVWRDDKKQFCKLAGIEKGLNKLDLHNLTGYSRQQQVLRRVVYGMNDIVIQIDSYCTLIMYEVLTPFYIFQIISLILWFIELYLYYSFAIIAMSLYGIIMTVRQTRENQNKLFKTAQAHGTITVCRNIGKTKYDAVFEEVPLSYLVPGDIIVIPRSGFKVPCDAVLLTGNCIVNESMLTGESVPVTKTPLPCLNSLYNEKEDVNHTLFCGTQIVQARYYANEYILAVVLRTGFLTAKGSLIRSILYPVPHDFKFDRDSYKFIGILAVIALIGMIYACWAKMATGAKLMDVITDSLDIITIVVPPALPAAMSVGKYYAQQRLLDQKITCMNPSVINVSGSVDCICFDKTGTLTEDGLDLHGVIPIENQELQGLKTDIHTLNYLEIEKAMASCHSLTLINGVISGDPLDVKMFEATKWILDETELTDTIKYDLLAPTIVKSPTDDLEIGILHQFQFSSNLQRMSVITRHLNSDNMTIYCKGSPEMIVSLSIPESVPPNLNSVLESQTEQGYRVIAIGYRTFPLIDIFKMKKLHRDEVECQLTFGGLIIFENRLKPQTASVITNLQQANMKLVMLTGDNIQTAICVAKECNMIRKHEELITVTTSPLSNGHALPQLCFTPTQADLSKYVFGKSGIFSITDVEFGNKAEKNHKYAMTGHTWKIIREYHPNRIAKFLQHGAIFARMSSDQKQQVIQELQTLNYYVAMCGDGANDCGALKAADVGISLSEAEASVASPFTSQQAEISCVFKVIKEGRAALVTAFGLFKYMVLYSLIEFFSTVFLFTYGSSLKDFQFLFIDGFLILISAFFFGQTKPYKGPLAPKSPNSSLLSVIPVMSMLLQFLLVVTVQVTSVQIVIKFPWYEPKNSENYAVYTVSQFQYLTLAVTYSFGKPYRESLFENKRFFFSLILLTCASLYITLWPWKIVEHLFELKLPPTIDFRLIVVALAFVNFIISIFFESFVVNYLLEHILSRKFHNKESAKLKKKTGEQFLKRMSMQHFSEIEVKCYGTMKS